MKPANKKKVKGQIELLEYRKIEEGFYEVSATTWDDKISFEGNMCGGLLKEFIKKVIAGGGKVKKVKHALVEREANKNLRHANAELRELRSKVSRVIKILE